MNRRAKVHRKGRRNDTITLRTATASRRLAACRAARPASSWPPAGPAWSSPPRTSPGSRRARLSYRRAAEPV